MAENEKIFDIPLRSAEKKSQRERASYSVKLVKKFLKTHLKVSKIKIGKKLNSELWKYGNNKSLGKVRVSTLMDDGVLKAELIGNKYEDFKPIAKKPSSPQNMQEKLAERLGPMAMKNQLEEDKIEGKDDLELPKEIEEESKEAPKESKEEVKEEFKKEAPKEEKDKEESDKNIDKSKEKKAE